MTAIDNPGDYTPPPDPENSITTEEAAEAILAQSEAPPVEPAPEEQPQPSVEDYEQGRQDASAETRTNQALQLKQQLQAEAQAIAQLEAENKERREYEPAEFAAVALELVERKQRLGAAAQQFDTWVQAEQEKVLQKEHAALTRSIPGWNADSAAQVVNYLKAQGYTAAQINQINDHKAVKIVWDAMGRGKRRGIPKSARKVSKRPPTVQPDAYQEMQKRNVSPHSIEGAAIRLERMMK